MFLECVGLYDCPWLAKAELLLQTVQMHFPMVDYRVTMKDKAGWAAWVSQMKEQRGWKVNHSPVIWQHLGSSDTPGQLPHVQLIGDTDDLCELVVIYFGLILDADDDTTASLLGRVNLNKDLYQRQGGRQEELERFDGKLVARTAVIGGSLRLLETILANLAPPHLPRSLLLDLRLYSTTMTRQLLEGIAMETVDLAATNIRQVFVPNSLDEAVRDADLVLLLEDYSKRLEEESSDWFERVQWAALGLAESLARECAPRARVLVGGDGPGCLVAELLRRKIPEEKVATGHLVALGSHVVSHAKGILSRRSVGSVTSGSISGLQAWGWPGLVGTYLEMGNATAPPPKSVGMAVAAAVVEDDRKEGDDNKKEEDVKPVSPEKAPVALSSLIQDGLQDFPTQFLQSQKEQIFKTRKCPPADLCLGNAVLTTLHIWLYSKGTEADGKKTRGRKIKESESRFSVVPGADPCIPGHGHAHTTHAHVHASKQSVAPPPPPLEPKPSTQPPAAAGGDEEHENRGDAKDEKEEEDHKDTNADAGEAAGDLQPQASGDKPIEAAEAGKNEEPVKTVAYVSPLDALLLQEEDEDDDEEDGRRAAPPISEETISLGVECIASGGGDTDTDAAAAAVDSPFPPGTFMVQPAECRAGIWEPVTSINESDNAGILAAVRPLWDQRVALLFGGNGKGKVMTSAKKQKEKEALGEVTDAYTDEDETDWNEDEQEEEEEESYWSSDGKK